ncbi:DUF1097 family protein (plasmid) [Rhizobium sp. RCAM05350]|nr:DUF1097 family protein [Rhizobium sp. RCAM05350]
MCLAIGIGFGIGAAFAVAALMPLIGPLAFGPVVFVVAIIVVSLRAAAPLNNVPAYFLGLITFSPPISNQTSSPFPNSPPSAGSAPSQPGPPIGCRRKSLGQASADNGKIGRPGTRCPAFGMTKKATA